MRNWYAFLCAFMTVASSWKIYKPLVLPLWPGTRAQNTRDLGLEKNMLSVCVHWYSLNCVNPVHEFCFFNIKI